MERLICASSGIGAETCRVLALRGVHVVMGVRNLSTGSQVREKIVEQVPKAKIEMLELDLSSMSSEQDAKVVINSLHPGAVVTNIARYWGFLNGLLSSLGKFVLKGVEQVPPQCVIWHCILRLRESRAITLWIAVWFN
uniref:Uncharacterized protein n=1 Tax=Setaria italica TaxID=4555 RepID=K3YAN6_SETIT